jgi:ATP-dependent exoDNAse (exonuclease V) alpha subunit
MITRNLDQRQGLVNGVQVVCEEIRPHTVTVRLASGHVHVIPRINFTITPSESGLPFPLSRRQYPLMPSYALTVHRVQGQSLHRLGIYFSGDAFCHGLLFTALSRVRSWASVIVWRENCESPGVCTLMNMVRRHIVAHLRNK